MLQRVLSRSCTLASCSSRGQHTLPSYTTQKAQFQKLKAQDAEARERWEKRAQLRRPILQRDEVLPPKVYYAPEWELDAPADKTDEPPNPMKRSVMSPEKWEYYNKVVWPPNYVVPETGLPKAREVFHCRESVHFSPKRMWRACHLVWALNVDEALVQLRLHPSKATVMLGEIIEEAKKRAVEEFHIEYPSNMHVAEAFPVQCNIVKGARRHAREKWCTVRYRYINIFVRLEEGEPPGWRQREKPLDGWEKMQKYYEDLDSRIVKYGL